MVPLGTCFIDLAQVYRSYSNQENEQVQLQVYKYFVKRIQQNKALLQQIVFRHNFRVNICMIPNSNNSDATVRQFQNQPYLNQLVALYNFIVTHFDGKVLTASVKDMIELQRVVCDESLTYYLDKLMNMLTADVFSEFTEELFQFLSSNEPIPYRFQLTENQSVPKSPTRAC